MKVRFFSFIRRAAGTSEVEAEAEDVGTLIEALCLRFGPAFREMVVEVSADGPRLRPDVTVLVNGRNTHFLAGVTTPLRTGDEVVFLPPAAGGSGR